MRAAALLLAAFLLAAAGASAAPAAVDGGTVLVNRGAVGIELGMKRAKVVDVLGPPLEKNQAGFMGFASFPNLFDVYLNAKKRVRLIGVSGEDFCTKGGICMFDRNGVRQLRERFGKRLKELEGETGERVLGVRGRHDGRRVFTSFTTTSLRPRGKIIMIFIGRCPPKPVVCGV